MDADRFFSRLNPFILWLLRAPLLHFIASGQLMALTFTGRRSGRRITIPVGYQREDETILVLISKAPRKQWWRNYREPGPVELWLRGRRRVGRACLVPAQDAAFGRAFARSFDRMPLLSRQFGVVEHQRGRPLSPEQLQVVAEQARLLRIELDPA